MKNISSITLAATYHPRGEIGDEYVSFARLERILPQLHAVYAGINVVVPPHTTPDDAACLRALFGNGLIISQDWSHGRHLALAHALDCPVILCNMRIWIG